MTIELYENQIPMYNWAREHLMNEYFLIDTSKAGSGKSYVVSKLIQELKLKPLIICTKSAKVTWKKIFSDYSIEYHDILNYCELRASTGRRIKHKYLIRVDSNENNKSVSFIPTDELVKIMSEGSLLVIDEIQNSKNSGADKTKAIISMIKTVLSSGISRMIFLSNTPFDKEEHVLNLLRMMGLIKNNILYQVPRGKSVVLKGLQELIDKCEKINREKTYEILHEYIPISKYNVGKILMDLYKHVVRPKYVNAMDPPEIPFTNDCMNGYYNLPEEDATELGNNLQELRDILHFDEENLVIQYNNTNLHHLKRISQKIENNKVTLIARLATEVLISNPKAKVVIFLNYLKPIARMTSLLIGFNPLVITGATSDAERLRNVGLFQENPEYRLFIGNIKVTSESISLHDLDGEYPRYSFISPNFSVIEVHQSVWRTFRTGSKSNATTRIIYGKGYESETRMQDALAKKSEVIRSIVAENESGRMLLPADYPCFIED